MKNGRRIPWSATAIGETFKISCLMGKLHPRDVLVNHSMARLSRLERWENITQLLLKTCRDCINLVQKIPGIFLGHVLSAGRIWKGDMLVADIEELRTDGRI